MTMIAIQCHIGNSSFNGFNFAKENGITENKKEKDQHEKP